MSFLVMKRWGRKYKKIARVTAFSAAYRIAARYQKPIKATHGLAQNQTATARPATSCVALLALGAERTVDGSHSRNPQITTSTDGERRVERDLDDDRERLLNAVHKVVDRVNHCAFRLDRLRACRDRGWLLLPHMSRLEQPGRLVRAEGCLLPAAASNDPRHPSDAGPNSRSIVISPGLASHFC